MRILHVTSGNLYGGIETMLVTMARFRESCPQLEQQFALCFEGRLGDELRESGVAVHDLGAVRARNPLSVRRARRSLRRVLDEQDIDIAICHAGWCQAIFGREILRSGRGFVVWQHAPPRMDFWLDRWAHRSQPDLFICNSKYTAGELSRWVGAARIEVVYCPVECKAIESPEKVRNDLRGELGVSANTVVITQVGRIDEYKGHVVLLDALHRLPESLDWRCWIVGGAQQPAEARYFAMLKGLVVSRSLSQRVQFLGERSDVARILISSDIFCQPNVEPEAFGIVFIEALSMGLPIVTSEMGGAIEIVDERCGLLVPPRDAAALARSLALLAQSKDLRQSLSKEGPVRAIELSDPADKLSSVLRLMRSLKTPQLSAHVEESCNLSCE